MLHDGLERWDRGAWQGGSRGKDHILTYSYDSRMAETNATLSRNYPPTKKLSTMLARVFMGTCTQATAGSGGAVSEAGWEVEEDPLCQGNLELCFKIQ